MLGTKEAVSGTGKREGGGQWGPVSTVPEIGSLNQAPQSHPRDTADLHIWVCEIREQEEGVPRDLSTAQEGSGPRERIWTHGTPGVSR